MLVNGDPGLGKSRLAWEFEKYIDGLSGLWNVNVGHGREELAQAAAKQIGELAYWLGADLRPQVVQAGKPVTAESEPAPVPAAAT